MRGKNIPLVWCRRPLHHALNPLIVVDIADYSMYTLDGSAAALRVCCPAALLPLHPVDCHPSLFILFLLTRPHYYLLLLAIPHLPSTSSPLHPILHHPLDSHRIDRAYTTPCPPPSAAPRLFSSSRNPAPSSPRARSPQGERETTHDGPKDFVQVQVGPHVSPASTRTRRHHGAAARARQATCSRSRPGSRELCIRVSPAIVIIGPDTSVWPRRDDDA
jgi:hypothetical protein